LAEGVVLDASAILAAIQQEIGGAPVVYALTEPERHLMVSSVNLCEVATKLVSTGHTRAEVPISLEPFLKYVVDFDQGQALVAAELARLTRPLGLSFGDRACLALATTHKATAWTTDGAWSKLKLDVKVRVLRSR